MVSQGNLVRKIQAGKIATVASCISVLGFAQTPLAWADAASTGNLRPPITSIPEKPASVNDAGKVEDRSQQTPTQLQQNADAVPAQGGGASSGGAGGGSSSTASMTDASVPMTELKNAVGRNDKRKPFEQAITIQASPHSIGNARVTPVAKDFDKTNTSTTSSDESIKLVQPPLHALVSIDRNLNPYGLEAQYSQELRLRDALLAASAGNLDILRTVSSVQSQRWRLLNSYTSYLPNITTGFNEIGLNSVSSIPITATARTNTAGLVTTGATGATGAAGVITTSAETIKTSIAAPITAVQSGFNWKPIQGGKLIYTALAEKHRLKAYRAQLRSDISDTLLSCAKDYYQLVLNDALLQIRTSAVATSTEQVRRNSALEEGGLATNLDILQAKTQLSKDRQNLINQQRQRRGAAIELAHLLNANLGQDLIPADKILRKVRLVSNDLQITDLLKTAIDNRPELKQYEELRQAAKKAIMISGSSLLPSVSLGGSIIGIASNIGRMEPTFMINFGVNWKFDGLGTTAYTNIQSSRWQARQALIDANQKFSDVVQQVRNSYNDSFTAESAIEESSNAVASANEELRLARLRLDTGLGTYLDVLTAQRDLTQANIDKAQAIVNFNTAQVQLVHDIGLVTIDNFTSGRLISTTNTR